MKQLYRSVWLCLAMAFAFSCQDEADIRTEGEFTVLTYNVAGLPEGLSSSDPKAHSDSISKLLNEFDIVHVQEDFCYNDKITAHLTHPYITPTKGCVPYGDGLNTFSRYPVFNLYRREWNHCNGTDCLTPKGFSYSRVRIQPGYDIDFYNVHANAGSEYMDLLARRKNIAQLCDYIRTHSEGEAVIVMGDFNCRYTREGDTIREVLTLGFTDVWIELIRGGVLPEQDGNSLTDCELNPTSSGCEVVDKIFYRSNARIKLTPVEYWHDDPRFYYTNGEPLSDHSPMFTRFRYQLIN